jgi:hypothetical protein
MIPLRNAVHIPMFWTMLDEKGNLKTETLMQTGTHLLDQLITWTKNLKNLRETKSQ